MYNTRYSWHSIIEGYVLIRVINIPFYKFRGDNVDNKPKYASINSECVVNVLINIIYTIRYRNLDVHIYYREIFINIFPRKQISIRFIFRFYTILHFIFN